MLSIFRKKRYLKEAIEDGIDIHCHILPGIDDGAQDIDESRMLIEGLRMININRAIVTPHIMKGFFDNNNETILNASEILREALETDSEFIHRASAEHMLDDNFQELLKQQSLLTHGDEYVLVEMSYAFQTPKFEKILFEMQTLGYKPIMAHPERYNYWDQDYDIQKLKDRGIHFQLNALSLSSYYGSAVQKKALMYLREGMYSFIGTDAHHRRHIKTLHEVTIKEKDFELVRNLWENNKRYFLK